MMRLGSIFAACGLAAVTVAATTTAAAAGSGSLNSPASTANWAQDGYGPGNTGFNPSEKSITPKTIGSLAYHWSIVSPIEIDPCEVQEPPIVAGGRLFMADEGGFAGYDATTGHQLWTVRFGDPSDDSVQAFAVSGTTLVVATDDCQSVSDPDGSLTAYDVASGHVLWTVHRDAPFYQLAVDQGVAVGSGADAGAAVTTAYKISNGHVLWNHANIDVTGGVSAHGRVLLSAQFGEGGASAVDITTGRRIWHTAKGWTAVAASPAGDRFLVTVGTNLLSVNAATGAVQWTATGDAGRVATDGTRIYVSVGNELLALNAATGAPQWHASVAAALSYGRPIVAGGVVYAAVPGAGTLTYQATTGAALAAGALDELGNAVGRSTVLNGRVYVTDGRILDVFSK